MKKRITYGALLVALLTYLLLGSRVYQLRAAGDKDDVYQQLELFARVLHRIRADYVDADKVSYKDLVHGALKGMLSSLDPHSEFMDITKYEELRQDTEGIYGGVGLQVGLRDGALTVIAPMEDSPAYEAGIMAGDRIVLIEGKGTDKFTQGDAVKRLRGDPGTKVTLSITRESFAAPREFILTRQDIRVFTAKDLENHRDFKLGPDKIGYVRLTQFGEKTADELEEGLKKLESQGMQSLVIDLRGNPGGLLDQAIAVCEKFLEKGQPIVSTEARSPANEIHKSASGRGKHRKYPMAVLVNGGSASAAEIVSGCLQDLKRATIIGEQSFGKGSVQSILPLTDGTALRLTTAKYYTPSHKVIHEKGITPDIVVPMGADEEIAIQLRRLPGGKENLEDALKTIDPDRRAQLRPLIEGGRDLQLERAYEVLKGTGGQLTKRLPEDSTQAADSSVQ